MNGSAARAIARVTRSVFAPLPSRTENGPGSLLSLTPNEYRLLGVLVKNADKVMTHRQLLHEVWGPGSGQESHYLRVYMNQLRQKIEPDPARPRFLLTETGVGYRFRLES